MINNRASCARQITSCDNAPEQKTKRSQATSEDDEQEEETWKLTTRIGRMSARAEK